MDHLPDYLGHHPWLAAYAILTAIAVLIFELRERSASAGALGTQDAIRLMNQGATLLDLREQQAFSQGHISGARHFDVAQIDKAAETLKRYKERPLILYCDRGTTGAAAARKLMGQGFTKVFNLRGGMAAWRAENLPLARGGG